MNDTHLARGRCKILSATQRAVTDFHDIEDSMIGIAEGLLSSIKNKKPGSSIGHLSILSKIYRLMEDTKGIENTAVPYLFYRIQFSSERYEVSPKLNN